MPRAADKRPDACSGARSPRVRSISPPVLPKSPRVIVPALLAASPSPSAHPPRAAPTFPLLRNPIPKNATATTVASKLGRNLPLDLQSESRARLLPPARQSARRHPPRETSACAPASAQIGPKMGRPPRSSAAQSAAFPRNFLTAPGPQGPAKPITDQDKEAHRGSGD